jgi:hypothetical protein
MFLTLLIEALNLMHPRFALAGGREYSADEAAEPPAARKFRERSVLLEFYHEFRRLWDQAYPVEVGLGHIVIQNEPDGGSRAPDLLFWQLGENGQPSKRLGAVSFAFLTNPAAIAADLALLARFHKAQGYPFAVSILVGRRADFTPPALPAGVGCLFFDIDRWLVAVSEPASP